MSGSRNDGRDEGKGHPSILIWEKDERHDKSKAKTCGGKDREGL
jgi:hypothetical protein